MRSLRTTSICSVLLAGSLLVARSFAQQSTNPDAASTEISLNDLLIRMQSNLADYLANVPSFFCDEHVDSDLQQNRAPWMKTVTESVFRLRRSKDPSGQLQFTESREIKTVNKRPAKGEDIHGPAIFSGAFTNAMSIVSLEMLHCYDYSVLPPVRLGRVSALVVGFALQESALSDKSCPSSEKETGRAYIDPRDFHLLRVETRIPNHETANGILTLWTWEIDYAPVSFDAKQFWLPKTIATKAEANDNHAVWSFTANYRNYHKLTVTSHIITDVGDNPAPPQ